MEVYTYLNKVIHAQRKNRKETHQLGEVLLEKERKGEKRV